MTIIWGLLCLSLIVFIHECGHFIAARLCGVAVESFSLGMGPVLFHKTINKTDYRISLFPLGGYCGMKGEKDFQKALSQDSMSIQAEPDSFYGASPFRRICIAFAGPFANIVFAAAAFTLISMTGFTYYSADNRVVMADEIYADVSSPAHAAGMQTGDIITAINGKTVKDFSEITQAVMLHPEEELLIEVRRNDRTIYIPVKTETDTSAGNGRLGIVSWIEPAVSSVAENSAAYRAGLRAGDVIKAVNGQQARNTAELQKIIGDDRDFTVTVLRQDKNLEFIYEAAEQTQGVIDGVFFALPKQEAPRYSFFPAVLEGMRETAAMTAATLKSLALLFKGTDISQSISGPARITVMLGDTVKNGFSAGIAEGISSVANFLAIISISLFIMNLLPVPILDGGLILTAFIEILIRRPLRPKTIYRIQFIGLAFIAIVFVIAMFSDIKYFIGR